MHGPRTTQLVQNFPSTLLAFICTVPPLSTAHNFPRIFYFSVVPWRPRLKHYKGTINANSKRHAGITHPAHCPIMSRSPKPNSISEYFLFYCRHRSWVLSFHAVESVLHALLEAGNRRREISVTTAVCMCSKRRRGTNTYRHRHITQGGKKQKQKAYLLQSADLVALSPWRAGVNKHFFFFHLRKCADLHERKKCT